MKRREWHDVVRHLSDVLVLEKTDHKVKRVFRDLQLVRNFNDLVDCVLGVPLGIVLGSL